MTQEQERSPEQWEAGDMIDDLKASIPLPGQPAKTDLCRAHTRALIWIIRHMNVVNPRLKCEDGSVNYLEISKGAIKAHGGTALVVLLILAHWWYTATKVVDPPTVVRSDSNLKTFIVKTVREAINDKE